MKKQLSTIIALALLTGCSAAGQATAKTIVDVSGAVCEAVFTSVDPTLAPLCTTGEQIAQAIEALVAQAAAPAVALKVSPAPYTPSNAEIYNYLVLHGATTAKL